MTPSEKLLWTYLKDRGLCKHKFRRQFPIDGFVLDFYCPTQKLGIELDGSVHDNKKEQDTARQAIIEDKGVKILRFTNKDVENNIENVLRKIKQNISPLHEVERGAPSLTRGGVRT